jgi:HrpA-like RNA helicase
MIICTVVSVTGMNEDIVLPEIGTSLRTRIYPELELKCARAPVQGLQKENIPEIQRSHLAASILQLKAIGIDNIMTFPWLDPPPAETAVRGMEQLYALGAINEHAR